MRRLDWKTRLTERRNAEDGTRSTCDDRNVSDYESYWLRSLVESLVSGCTNDYLEKRLHRATAYRRRAS